MAGKGKETVEVTEIGSKILIRTNPPGRNFIYRKASCLLASKGQEIGVSIFPDHDYVVVKVIINGMVEPFMVFPILRHV